MCRMLGMAGQGSEALSQFLGAFYPLSSRGLVNPGTKPGHKDGWGLAGYPNGLPVYYGRRAHDAASEPHAWMKSVHHLEQEPTPIVMAHFRKASVGHVATEDTHPFHKKHWLFCHHGTLFSWHRLPLTKYHPEGHTDSERLFLFLLEAAEHTHDHAEGLKKGIEWIRRNHPHNSLTFLMSDGRSLYGFRSFTDQLLDKGETAEERQRFFTLWTAQWNGLSAACSEPILTDRVREWRPLANGEFLTLEPGQKPRVEPLQ